jgi:hypothetical protein
MWWLANFKQGNTAMVKELGTLTGTEMDSVEGQVRLLLKQVRDYRNGEGKNLKEDSSMLMDLGPVTLTHMWVRLDESPDTLEEKCIELSEVQWSYLELKVIMDYYAWQLLRIQTKVNSPGVDVPGIFNVVGCITS